MNESKNLRMSKKICEFSLSPDLGGLELYMMRYAHFLGNQCISVINESGKLKGYFEKSDDRYVTIKRRNVFLSWLGARKLARIIDEESIDILHLHWTKDLPLAIMAKLLSHRKPKVVQSRHMSMTRFKADFFHRFLYKNLDAMIAVTQQVKDQIQKFVPNDICPRVEVLYIGADQPQILSEELKRERREDLGLGESFTVGIIGRIEPQKGQWVVIDALEKLIHQGIDAKALIVGHAMSDEYLHVLQKDVVIRGMSEQIHFTGFTNEAQTIMQLCDVMVLATDRETFGLVLIEAMMCGVCVIASDSGGPLEIIDDGVNGMVFKTFDSEDLATKLGILYRDEALRERFAVEGKIKAQTQFESQAQFEALRQLMESL